ncbi:hypothetical protein [Streptomyces xanthophaeus]|uniref:hypothetical protein n=1 Tax=Streptomyces xanthophaeus TaxID=67385 RepID=UPI002647866C|nr:hypothetical protein [Streptomyces xanthophaeus]WKD33722.1 hypothetical protein KO717_18290 [Streptomyces xanthophaeus]
MTPPTGRSGTTGTIRHPDVSEISDLTEGLLSPSRTAEIRRHLGDCALCADVRASLEEIRSLLGTLPGPARMPADIAGRIDAALAAEALLDATQPQAPAVPADRPRTPDRDVSRGTPPATAGSYPRPAGHPAGPTGPGRRRARRRIAVLAGLTGAAACALGIFLFGDFSDAPTHGTAASDSAARPSAAAAAGEGEGEGNYTAQGLQDSVRQLIAGGQGAKKVPEEQNNTLGLENTAPGDKRAAPSVPTCVQGATGRPDTPLATERGSYQGTPVYLLVLPHPADSARVDAYLVDTACERTGSADPGKVLLKSTYPR